MEPEGTTVLKSENPYYDDMAEIEPETKTIQNSANPYYDIGMEGEYADASKFSKENWHSKRVANITNANGHYEKIDVLISLDLLLIRSI